MLLQVEAIHDVAQTYVNRGRSEFDSSGMGAGTDVGGVQGTPLPAVQEPEVENDVPGPTQVCKMDLPTIIQVETY